MDIQSLSQANSILCWFIVITAVIGYLLTVRRLKQKWAFWIVLMFGWTLLAISNSLVALHIRQGTYFPLALWLSSYVMVTVSLVLLFLKLVQLMETRKEPLKQGNESLPQIDQGGSKKKCIEN